MYTSPFQRKKASLIVLISISQVSQAGRSNSIHSDSFFAQHETIMKSQTPEQIEALRATLVDIRSAVTNCKQQQAEPVIRNQGQENRSDESPIWEIRWALDCLDLHHHFIFHGNKTSAFRCFICSHTKPVFNYSVTGNVTIKINNIRNITTLKRNC